MYHGLIPQKTVEETIFILPQRRAASSDARGSSLSHTHRSRSPYGNPRGREKASYHGAFTPRGSREKEKEGYNLWRMVVGERTRLPGRDSEDVMFFILQAFSRGEWFDLRVRLCSFLRFFSSVSSEEVDLF